MAPTPVSVLLTSGIAPDRALRLAHSLGLPCRPAAPDAAAPADGTADPRAALLVQGEGAGAVDLWQRPVAAWVEVGPLTDDALAQAVSAASAADLFASFTTASANRLHLAGRLVAAIAERRPLSDAQRDDLELALHEAISNALVHGNLQVEGMKGLSVAALDRFSAELASRMADPAYAGRRIVVRAWLEPRACVVEVADEGTGFAPRAPAGTGTAGGGASGRGLDLISAIAEGYELLDDGRRIRMRFRL
ncbi:ATP-binding protein [Azospirillum halopraeferens]|uniref:ATP-binding protein n=1 Tax=Azospirillum halopraeferens TaxID=34010 RepID=UPI00040F6314|nr:ATP-binding protein [Azospirillum halopraeferens]